MELLGVSGTVSSDTVGVGWCSAVCQCERAGCVGPVGLCPPSCPTLSSHSSPPAALATATLPYCHCHSAQHTTSHSHTVLHLNSTTPLHLGNQVANITHTRLSSVARPHSRSLRLTITTAHATAPRALFEASLCRTRHRSLLVSGVVCSGHGCARFSSAHTHPVWQCSLLLSLSLSHTLPLSCPLCAMSGVESDEQLARRLQAEEFASLGLSPVTAFSSGGGSGGLSAAAATGHVSSYSYPAVSDPSFAHSHSYIQQSPQPSPSSSPVLSSQRRDDSNNPSARPLLPPSRYRPAQRVRQNAIDNLNQTPSQHSTRLLTLYFMYAAAELATSIALLSRHWHDSCNVPLRVWVILHSARWLFFLPLAVHQRHMVATSQAGALVSDGTKRLKLWLKYAVFVIWIVGLYWLFTADADSCKAEGGGVLFTYAIVLVVMYGVRLALPLVVVLLLCLCLPCVLLFFSYIAPNPGASRQTIDSLPTRTYSRPAATAAASSSPAAASADGSDSSPAGSSEADVPSCAICMQEYEDGDVLRVLPCQPIAHEFHQQCCDRWLESNSTCPLCRTAVSQEGREEQERERQREREQERLDREAREEMERQDEHDCDMQTQQPSQQAVSGHTIDIV